MAAATPTPRRWTLPCWWARKGHRTHRTGYTKHSAHCLHFPPSLSKPALQPQPHASPLWSCRPVRAAHLGEPRCSTPFLHRVISGAPALTASRCFRPVHPSLLTPHSQDHQVFDQHKFGLSTALRPRFPSLQPSCPAENSNPVNERKYQGLCLTCAATTAAPLCTASHLLLRRAVPIDRDRTAACTKRRRRR